MIGRGRSIRFVITPESTATATNPASNKVTFGPEREVRFAVVMYGGVSLAIYINGVAQELLNLVRATAPKSADPDEDEALLAEKELTGAGKVYRRLGQYLYGDRDKLGGSQTNDPAPIKTRFVVDVISGTSAGGINGVFLAKALARDQGMDGLKKLWLSEGDLAKLLNDKGSIKDLSGFKLKQPQESLLNSQRMYRKLLEALDQMGASSDKKAVEPAKKYSPLVGELDLFITTTDIDGIPLPISLSDEVVYERRYKNVFHFRYTTEETTGSDRDDFIKENDPFLAFAARSTSSFPFAFEPMRLRDIAEIANAYPPYKDKTDTGEWDKFFSDYLRNGLFDLDREASGQAATGHLPDQEDTEQNARKTLRESFRDRSFGDGGYLDNKPFSYATSMLIRRHADRAVARKLLYVEPSPEHPELTIERRDPPDFAKNVRAAVLDLPRQETIREDFDRLYDRNEMLERVGMLAKEVDADMEVKKSKPIAAAKFEKQGLRQMIRHYGVSYGAYHRLKVTELTAVLAEIIARAAGHDPTSDAGDAIRELVRAWRRNNYDPFKPKERKDPDDRLKKTENEFLHKFDIRYDLRRLAFLNRRINQLAELDEDAKRLLKTVCPIKEWPKNLDVDALISRHGADFKSELNRIKRCEVSKALKEARSAEERLRKRDSDSGKKLYEAVGTLKIGWPDLKAILNCDPGADRERKAEGILKDCGRSPALSILAEIIYEGFKWEPPKSESSASQTPGALAARACVEHYRENFVFYDLVTYPVQYGTGAGEANVVDVFRVSPEDATAILNQRESGRQKLAGTALMSFGAFLDEAWRRNDMLWGRLDGAERLISALLPETKNETVRDRLIKEAQIAILDEESKTGGLIQARPDLDSPEKIWKYYRDEFRVDRELAQRTALQLISRAANVTGNMLEGLAEKHRFTLGKRIAASIAWLGAVFWNILAVAFAVTAAIRKIFGRTDKKIRAH